MQGLTLADSQYNTQGKIDILLGVEVFVEIIRQGRRSGPTHTLTALNTAFGWVLAGNTNLETDTRLISTDLT